MDTRHTQQVTGGPGEGTELTAGDGRAWRGAIEWPGTLRVVRQQWHNGTDTMGAEASQTWAAGESLSAQYLGDPCIVEFHTSRTATRSPGTPGGDPKVTFTSP